LLNFQKIIAGEKRNSFFACWLEAPGSTSSLKSFIFIIAVILSFPLAFAQAPLKVAIFPVTIHSPEKLDYLREGLVDMLSARVELSGRVMVLEKGIVKRALDRVTGEMDVESAKNLGLELSADFVVFGSLTKLGDSASLDLKVVEVKGAKPSVPVFVQAKKMEEIIGRVDDLARKIDEQVLGYPLTPPVVERPKEAPKEMAGIPAPPLGFQPMGPARGVGSGEFWRSQPFPFNIKGMAIGDLDGDGKNEVALIDDRNLRIYRWEKTEFKLIQKIDGGKLDQYLAVDVADVDKDGKAEIFVTNMQGEQLASFVVAHKDGAFRIVSSGLDWFLRAVDWGEKGTVLLGQKRGYQKGFEWPIYEMGWDGKKYKDIRKADLPKIFSIYGFIPFAHDGKTDYLFIDSDFSLKVMNEKGKVVWKGRDDYGSDNVFRVKDMAIGAGLRFEDADDLACVNVRVIRKGKDFLVIRNISATGQFLKRTKLYTKGEVQYLTWTGAMFMASWKSQEIPGYIADFELQDVDGEKGKELVVAVNLPSESFLSGEKNSALMVSRIEGVQ